MPWYLTIIGFHFPDVCIWCGLGMLYTNTNYVEIPNKICALYIVSSISRCWCKQNIQDITYRYQRGAPINKYIWWYTRVLLPLQTKEVITHSFPQERHKLEGYSRKLYVAWLTRSLIRYTFAREQRYYSLTKHVRNIPPIAQNRTRTKQNYLQLLQRLPS